MIAHTASELLEGTSLRQLGRDQSPLCWRDALYMLRELCFAVAEARCWGDQLELTPDTIYLEDRPGRRQRVKILAVSLSAMRGPDPTDTSRACGASDRRGQRGKRASVFSYYPPERLMERPVVESSAVYTLGVIAYELLTGRVPFADAVGPAGLVTAQLKRVPEPPSAIQPGVPAEIDLLVLRCLEKSAGDRYADVTALAVAVTTALLA